MVPTPANIVTYNTDGTVVVTPDKNSSKSVITSIFGSFADAPGGLKEELQEVTVSLGAEYWYRKQFAVRAGYFNESQYKGNRKYFTAGVGIKLNIAAIDVSYVVPVEHNNPLANTVRFTMLFNVESFLKRRSPLAPTVRPVLLFTLNVPVVFAFASERINEVLAKLFNADAFVAVPVNTAPATPPTP